MNRIQLEHIIRAASEISDDSEIVVIGSQAIHAQDATLPPIAFQSAEADVFPLNQPERADEVDAAIGELSIFHETYGYYAHGVSPRTAILPTGWEQRLVRVAGPNTGGATGLCLGVLDLLLSKYAAGREKDLEFNREMIRSGCATKRALVNLVPHLPVDDKLKSLILARIQSDFAAANQHRFPKLNRSNVKVVPNPRFPMSLAVRSATPDDEQQVIALWHACDLVASYNDPVADFRFAKAGPCSDVLVAVDEAGAIMGSVMVGHDGHRGWLYYVAASPASRGEGVGRRVVEAAENWLREHGVAKAQLLVRETNTKVVSFYEHLGFETAPRVVMSKWLAETP